MTKILFYDLETTPLPCYVWRLGEQVVRHNQLIRKHGELPHTRIICATYCWNDGKSAKSIGWGFTEQDSQKVVVAFDDLIRQADHIIGKNSDSFDNKHLNTVRLLEGGKPIPDWTKKTDDLEKHIRKAFNLPSNSLDYLSEVLGLGGKIKMEFDDWVSIVERHPVKGPIAYKKMLKYGLKDVEDTRAAWDKVAPHILPKLKVNCDNAYGTCVRCGSTQLRKDGCSIVAGIRRQRFECKSCGRFAGTAAIKKDGTFGKVQ